MSICRWSDNDHQCDVYVYDSAPDEWVIHVKARRPKLDGPLPEPMTVIAHAAEGGRVGLTEGEKKEWQRLYNERNAILDAAPRIQIGLPHDGETFVERSEAECAERLEELRGLGYNVPQRAIDSLREDAPL